MNSWFTKYSLKSSWKKVLSFLIVLLTAIFFLRYFISNWQQVINSGLKIKYALLALSILAVPPVIISGLLWRQILIKLSSKSISNTTAIRIHIYSWLLKYIPGKAGTVSGKYYLSIKQGIPKKDILLSTLYEYIFLILSSLLIGIITIAFSPHLQMNVYISIPLVFLVIGILAFLLIPQLFYFFINFGAKFIIKREINFKKYLNTENLFKFLGLYLIPRGFDAFIFAYVIFNYVTLDLATFIYLAGSYVMAIILGFLSIIAPSGFGVREGFAIYFASQVVPTEIAVFATILTRVIITLADIWLLLINLKFNKK
jgi:glycosyltransferase 2 family protein